MSGAEKKNAHAQMLIVHRQCWDSNKSKSCQFTLVLCWYGTNVATHRFVVIVAVVVVVVVVVGGGGGGGILSW